MAILDFKEANCKNCYKCLRTCPVKAISFKDSKARVVDSACILCGHCVSVCPQNAKYVRNDIPFVKELIASNKKVYASVAPSFAASFSETDRDKLFSAIASLGFERVIDTAQGAEVVTAKYDELIASGKYRNFITSACPALVRLVRTSYPDALEYLAPVDSPMVAHAKMLRERYGEDIAVVFIGPCIAKKREAEECGVVDAALTFEELGEWFNQEEIVVETQQINADKIELFEGKALFYPINRGIIKSFYKYSGDYDYVYVDGVAHAEEVLANISDLSGMVIEVSACENSCVGGPCAIAKKGGFLKANEQVRNFAKKNSTSQPNITYTAQIDRSYTPIIIDKSKPSERDIRSILAKIGKFTHEDELNCGACGYPSCREKAIAVYQGIASLEMCLPYMRERAESISEEMFRNSPNGVITVDEDLIIHDMNDKAKDIFGIHDDVKGKDLVDYINPTEFVLAINGDSIINKKIHIGNTDRWVVMSIYKVDKHNLYLCTLNDVTKDVSYEESRRKVKIEMAKTTQKVIEKQMEIVQEIASLLGETTADTKVALTKLKDAVINEYEEK